MGQRLRKTARQTPTVFAKVWATSPRTVRTTGNEDAINAAVEVTRIGTSPTNSPQVLLRDDQWHPHHCPPNAHVCPDDRHLRMQFCEWLHKHAANYPFLHKILRTDNETTVTYAYGI
jgi:hypothetical protein